MAAVATIRFGRLRHLADFPLLGEEPRPRPHQACVVRTERGVEVGTCLAVADAPGGATHVARRSFVRVAAPEDLERARAQRERDDRETRALCLAAIERLGLAIRFVGAETLLDGERTVLHYAAEDRADLRELARELERALSTRIELRQVGARERARSCGGVGPCGLTLCCSTFLRQLEPVTLRMAKVQGLALSPERTSGACGRLRCCLRYEHPLYEDAHRGLPAVGERVETARGTGKVVRQDILGRRVTLETEEGRLLAVHLAELGPRRRAAPPPPPAPEPPPPPAAPPAPPEPGRWARITRRLLGRFGRDEPGPPAADGGPPPA